MPKGYKTKKTVEKEKAREALRAIVVREMEDMVAAQIAHAKGLSHLVTRDRRTGKFIRVTQAMARHKFNHSEHEEIIEVWEKDPNVQAFTDLMNRALDKPNEQEIEVALSGGLDLVNRLAGARARAAGLESP